MLDRNELDRHITGNYGEDQFPADEDPNAADMPTDENAYQVVQGCIFDLLRARRNCVDDHNADLIAYINNKIKVLEQVQKDLIAYDKLRDAIKLIVSNA